MGRRLLSLMKFGGAGQELVRRVACRRGLVEADPGCVRRVSMESALGCARLRFAVELILGRCAPILRWRRAVDYDVAEVA